MLTRQSPRECWWACPPAPVGPGRLQARTCTGTQPSAGLAAVRDRKAWHSGSTLQGVRLAGDARRWYASYGDLWR